VVGEGEAIAAAAAGDLGLPMRLLLASRGVAVPMSSHLIVVALSSSKPFFVHGLKKAVPFSGDVGAEDTGIQ
jgi:hypothetical protein